MGFPFRFPISIPTPPLPGFLSHLGAVVHSEFTHIIDVSARLVPVPRLGGLTADADDDSDGGSGDGSGGDPTGGWGLPDPFSPRSLFNQAIGELGEDLADLASDAFGGDESGDGSSDRSGSSPESPSGPTAGPRGSAQPPGPGADGAAQVILLASAADGDDAPEATPSPSYLLAHPGDGSGPDDPVAAPTTDKVGDNAVRTERGQGDGGQSAPPADPEGGDGDPPPPQHFDFQATKTAQAPADSVSNSGTGPDQPTPPPAPPPRWIGVDDGGGFGTVNVFSRGLFSGPFEGSIDVEGTLIKARTSPAGPSMGRSAWRRSPCQEPWGVRLSSSHPVSSWAWACRSESPRPVNSHSAATPP